MAEMWTRSPIMQGNTEQHQLTLISQLCGSITPEVRARVWASCGGQERGVKQCCGQGPGRSTPGPLPCPVRWLLHLPGTGVCLLLAGRLGKLLQMLFASWEPSAQWDAALSLLPCVNYSCDVTCAQPPKEKRVNLASQTSFGRGELCPCF